MLSRCFARLRWGWLGNVGVVMYLRWFRLCVIYVLNDVIIWHQLACAVQLFGCCFWSKHRDLSVNMIYMIIGCWRIWYCVPCVTHAFDSLYSDSHFLGCVGVGRLPVISWRHSEILVVHISPEGFNGQITRWNRRNILSVLKVPVTSSAYAQAASSIQCVHSKCSFYCSTP